jgi:hypothetical protein
MPLEKIPPLEGCRLVRREVETAGRVPVSPKA